MSLRKKLAALGAAALLVLAPALQAADSTSEKESLDVLRNTVVNLLQSLVDRGVLTREQAETMVKQAQEKAASDALAAQAKSQAEQKEEETAVRVPYVPQIVKDEISKQVEEQVKPQVVADVVNEAKLEKWGVPAALPEWLSRTRLYGDVTFRGQADFMAADNSYDQILNYQAINTAGGIAKTADPFLNTTENSDRFRLRARLGLEATLTSNWSAGIRLSSGSLTDPGSASQTLGTYGGRYTVGLDEAYIRWDALPTGQPGWMSAIGGRFADPWFTPTELVYARDLTFEGVAGTWRFNLTDAIDPDRSQIYVSTGAFPMLDQPTAPAENKWLVGAQLGTKLRWAGGQQHLQIAGAYYDFLNVTGKENAPDSTLLNYTAPAFIRTGNTYFDIANSTDPTVNLYALAAHFRLIDLAAAYQLALGKHALLLNAEAVRNVGYNEVAVEALAQQTMPKPEDIGYVAEIGYGDPVLSGRWDWMVRFGYRYVRRDALLDAWTDADFHEGGTNTEGYIIRTDLGLAPDVWLRLRYMSGNEIDGPRYGLDILQLDLNTRF
jgi:hypothetical protein